jgi:oligopeptidase B
VTRPLSPRQSLREESRRNRLSRRRLLQQAGALGLSLPALGLLSRFPVSARQAEPVPPVAQPIPDTLDFDGFTIEDPYAWLENVDDPETIAYLEAENAYTEEVLEPTAALRETLYQEMVGRIQREDTQVPFRMGPYFYYTRTEEGLDYPIFCRKLESLDAPEEILIDLNAIAGEYLEPGYFAPSYDHRYLAYALNETGGIEFTIHFKDLESGEVLPDLLPSDGAGFDWAADNRTLFYTRQDETLRPFELYRHELGSDPADDPMLYREDDPIFGLALYTTDDREYMLLDVSSYESSEIRYLRTDDPTGNFTLFAPRQPKVQYYLEHYDDDFLVLTNEGAVNFKLLATPVAEAQGATILFRELIPHDERRLLEWVNVFRERMLIYGREDGLSKLWIFDPASNALAPVAFDEPVHTVWPGENREFDTTKATIGYTSFVTPFTFYELDLLSGERTLLKQEEVVGGHNPDDYVSERLFATAPDGVQVPISLVRRRDAPAGPKPMLLAGYGAYGISYDPYFASNELSLIDRGVTFAIAHIRGGQELGRPWYEDGKLLRKKNTFSDYIACAEHLIDNGYTAADKLVANGGSAGGMLMGVIANERPDLFQTIIAEVAFVDVLRVMLDPSQPLTTSEYVEWGDPRDPAYYDYIASYSPYDNVTAQDYPNLFLTAGIEDDQVPYWQPAKWTARLRATKTDDNVLLLRTNMGAGHGGESGFYDYQRETTWPYAFLLLTVGLEDVEVEKGMATPVATPRPL